MVEFVAKLFLFVEGSLKFVLLFIGIMSIIWLFQVLKDPAKQFDLAMQLFKNIFVWAWKSILFVWLSVVYIFNVIVKIFTITFATIRDFFVSKN